MTPPAIVVSDIVLRHAGEIAVSDVSGKFAPGSLTAIAGPNGAGKTTLLRAIAGLHAPYAGRIDYEGPPAEIALLPQSAELDRGFPISCRDLVTLGHWPRTGAFQNISDAMRYAADAALATMGILDLGPKPIRALSAGQFQRALFARLLVQDAPIVLLDEPFGAVDERTAFDLLDVLLRWHGEGRTVIVVLHDIDLISRYFPETLLLARQCIAWGPTAQALSPANRARAKLGVAEAVRTRSAA